MADSEELESQLGIQTQINKILKSRDAMLRAQRKELSAQTQIAIELANALQGKELEGMQERLTAINESLNIARQRAAAVGSTMTEGMSSAGEAVRSTTADLTKTNKAMEELVESTREASTLGEAFGNIMKHAGLITGVVGLGDALKSTGTFAAGLKDTIFGLGQTASNVATGAFNILSSAMGFLFKKSMEAHGAGLATRQAWNELNATFAGSTTQLNAATEAAKNLTKNTNSMSAAGRTTAQVFGAGVAGAAAAIEYTTEMAKSMGDTFGKLAHDFKDNIGTYAMATKGLGLTGEAFKSLELTAKASGKEVSEVLNDQARMVVGLSAEYDISFKQMGTNLDEMLKDTKIFGRAGSAEFTATAAYAAKLGIAISDLQGLTSKTDDFEGAAMAAAELGAQFGMTIDTMELMTAGPAEKAEMVRQAFLETGQSFEDMSRQEKARMAELTNMSEDALAGMMDPANADLGFDDMQDAAQAAADGAVTQEEANMALAKSITKLEAAMGGLTKHSSPWGAFLDGVITGIMNSEEMLALLSNLSSVMITTYQAGKKVGAMFVKMFPGVKDILGALTELFDPEKWTQMMEKVKTAFEDFFKDLSGDDPGSAVGKFTDKLGGIFETFFSKEAIEKLKAGFVKFIEGFGALIAGLIPVAVKGLTKVIESIISFIKGESDPLGDAANSTIGGAFATALSAIWVSIKESGPMLLTAMKDLFFALVTSAGFKKFMAVIGGLIMAKFIMSVILAAGKAVGIQMLADFLQNKYLKKGMVDPAAESGAEAGRAAAEGQQAAAESTKGLIETLRDIKTSDIRKAMEIGLYLVGFIMIAVVGMATALMVAAKIMSGMTMGDLVKSMSALAGAVLSVAILAKVAKDVDSKDLLKAGQIMPAMALFIGTAVVILAVALRLAGEALKGLSAGELVPVFAALGLLVLSVIALAKYGSEIDSGKMMEAGKGLLVATGFISVALLGFVVALGAATVPLRGISTDQLIQVFAALGALILSTIIIAEFGSKISAGTMAKAGLGLTVASVAIGVSLVLFALALKAVSMALEGVSTKRLGAQMKLLGLVILGSIVMFALAALMAADGGVTIGMASYALVLASVAMGVSLVLFAGALKLVSMVLDGVDTVKLEEQLILLGKVILGSIVMFAAAALLAAATGGGAALVIAGVALAAAAVLFVLIVDTVAPAMVDLHNTLAVVDMPLLERQLVVLAAVIGGVGLLAAAMALLAAATGGGIAMAVGGLALVAAGKIFVKITEDMVPGMVGMHTALAGVDMPLLERQLLVLGLVLGGVGLLAAAMAVLAVATGGGLALAAGALVLLAAGKLFDMIAKSFSPAMVGLYKALDGVDLKRFVSMLGSLGLTLGALAVMVLAGAPMVLIGAAGFGILGNALEGAADFLVAASEKFAVASKAMMTAWAGVEIKRLVRVIAGMGVLMGQFISLIGIGALGAIIAYFPSLKEGVVAAAEFLESSFEAFESTITALKKIPMEDPKEMEARINVIGGLMRALQSISGLGLDMAKLAIVGALLGDDGASELINSTAEFVEKIGVALSTVVTGLVAAASGMDEGALKGASAVASMIAAVAELAAAVSAPMQAAMAEQDILDTMMGKDIMAEMASGMGDLITKLTPKLKIMVAALSKAMSGMEDPETFAKKATAFGKGMKAVSILGDVLGKFMKIQKQGAGTWYKKEISLDDLFNTIATIVGSENLKKLFKAMETAPSADLALMDTFGSSITGLGKLATKIGRATTQLVDAADDMHSSSDIQWGAGHIDGAITDMNDIMMTIAEKSADLGTKMDAFNAEAIDQVVENIRIVVQSYNKTGELLSKIKPIDLDAILGEVTNGLEIRRQTITVKDENIHITLNLDVTMKADEVAHVLVKEKLVKQGENYTPL